MIVKCYSCHKQVDKFEMVPVDIGGPHEGCSEWASDEMDAPVCIECLSYDHTQHGVEISCDCCCDRSRGVLATFDR